MKKKIFAIVLASMLLLTAACGQNPGSSTPASTAGSTPSSAAQQPASTASQPAQPQRTTLKIAALKGPSAVGMLKLMEDSQNGESSLANDYDYTLAGAPDQIVGGVINGEYDIAVLPTNLAATVYNKTGGSIKLATINTLGVLYIVEAGDAIQSAADLAGKTIYSSGKGSTPEYALDYILTKNGMTPGGDVMVEYMSEHSEIAAQLAAGKAEVALLPQPFVESVLAQNSGVRVALDLTKEWETVSQDGSSLAMSGIVVQQKLLEENPQAVAAFLEEYESSTRFVTDPANLDTVAEWVVNREIIGKAAIAKKAIPQCNIVFRAGGEMKSTAEGFLNILFEANPQSVGGALPDEGFYYIP